MLALTSDPEAFLKEWHSTPHEHVPRLVSASTVRRGGAIFALVFFAGCAEEGKPCGATIDFKVLRPDASTYAEHMGLSAWRDASPHPHTVMLSPGYLKVTIEPEDPFGKYLVQAAFRAPATGAELLLSEPFEVVP